MGRAWLSAFVLAGACRFGFGGDPAALDSAPGGDGDGGTQIDDGDLGDGGSTSDGASATVDAAPLTCPESYTTIIPLTSRYLLLAGSLDWLAAEAQCEADGMHLMIPDDSNELQLLASRIPTQSIWIGVTDRIAVGTWRKVTGGIATYLPWDEMEPTAAAPECVYISGTTLKLLDQGCAATRRAYCECDRVPVDPTSY